MYSKTIEPKVNQMFSEISDRLSAIIESSQSNRTACDRIAKFVASETATKSKTMLNDMYAALSKQVLDSIPDVAKQNRFYEANLRHEILGKYDFKMLNASIDYSESNKVIASLGAAVGTALVGGLLVCALSPASPALPIAVISAACLTVFCMTYFKTTPNTSKSDFKLAINKYLSETKESYLAWFDEVERYFNKRVDEIFRVL